MLTERVVFYKLTPAEFRAIYTELTGDASVADNTLSKEVDAQHKAVLTNVTPGLAKDLRIHNGRKGKFDKFWEIAAEVISDITAVDDRRDSEATTSGDVVNMSIDISAPKLFLKFVKEQKKVDWTIVISHRYHGSNFNSGQRMLPCIRQQITLVS